MKIYLIGMPGSGKTTLGKQIAEALHLPFIDLDHEIEKSEQRSIAEIFSESGEDFFRLRESEILRNLITTPESFVLATGGGAPCFFGNIDLLNESGLTIYLNVSVGTLLDRLRDKMDRPLLNDRISREQNLKALLEKRNPVYKKAKLEVSDADSHRLLKAIHDMCN